MIVSVHVDGLLSFIVIEWKGQGIKKIWKLPTILLWGQLSPTKSEYDFVVILTDCTKIAEQTCFKFCVYIENKVSLENH